MNLFEEQSTIQSLMLRQRLDAVVPIEPGSALTFGPTGRRSSDGRGGGMTEKAAETWRS
jgi:hypothetical protein